MHAKNVLQCSSVVENVQCLANHWGSFSPHPCLQSWKKSNRIELIKVGFVLIVAALFENCYIAKIYQKIPSGIAVSGPGTLQPTISI